MNAILAVRAILILSLLSVAAPARAQPEAPSGSIYYNPEVVGRCLCLKQSVTELAADLAAAKTRYEDGEARLRETEAELDRARGTIDVNDPGAVDAFRRLLEAHERAGAEQFRTIEPDYAAAARRYNRSVAAYNGLCAGHPLDPDAIRRTRASLVCRHEAPSNAP